MRFITLLSLTIFSFTSFIIPIQASELGTLTKQLKQNQINKKHYDKKKYLDEQKRYENNLETFNQIKTRISVEEIEVASDGEASTTARRGVVTVNSSLNVRDGVWGSVIGSLGPNAEVEIIGQEGEFLTIRYQGRIAYVHSDYVRITGGDSSVTPTSDDGSSTPSDSPINTDVAVTDETGGVENGGTPVEINAGDFQVRNTLTGSAFMEQIANLSGAARERAIQEAILAGQIPASLMQFQPVTVTRRLSDGREHTITYNVAPDYLAIGTDSDNVRIPTTPITAQLIAERLGCILPSKLMVDQIYSAANTKLSPQPMSGGQYPNWERRMTTSGFFAEHDRLIDSRLSSGTPSGIIAGHKKDIVITNRLNQRPNNVAIYGWHQRNNQAIQPLSTVHGNSYVDYSHGVRLISGRCSVDGQEMSMADVLRDPVLSGLISHEGAINDSRATR